MVVTDHFGLFLITCPNFVSHIKFSEVKDLVLDLETPMNESLFTPSKYWSDLKLREIMENWDHGEVAWIPTKEYDTTDTQRILNEIILK